MNIGIQLLHGNKVVVNMRMQDDFKDAEKNIKYIKNIKGSDGK